MDIIIRHKSSLRALAHAQAVFLPLTTAAIAPIYYRRWKLKEHNSENREIQIIHVTFIGKSGYGKSSLINAVIGKDVMKTSAVEACTKEAQNASFCIYDDYFLSFAEVPGVGESDARDAEYMVMYKTLVGCSDVIVHILRADCRDYAIDQKAFELLFPDYSARSKVIIALNACDKIEPLNRQQHTGPSAEQLVQVQQKQNTLRTLFPRVHEIIPCCASPAWNLEHLSRSIASLLLSAPGITVRLGMKVRG